MKKISKFAILILIGGIIMAYIRVNWSNKPNVTTSISAKNLNIMDKGIADNDVAIQEIKSELVDVNNNLKLKRDKSVKITTNDIDKSSDANKIHLLDLSEEVHAAMAGTAPVISTVEDNSITTEKYADNSVVPKKTNFFEFSKNLANPDDFTTDYYVSQTSGNIIAYPGMILSGLIEVEGEKPYRYSNSLNKLDEFRYAWYDENMTFISGAYGTQISTSPANAKYIRFSNAYPTALHQLEQSDITTTIEEYAVNIKKEYINIGSGAIKPENTVFFEAGKNKFNKNSALIGKYVSPTTGNLPTNEAYFASDYIAVTAGEKYTKNNRIFYAWYNSSKAFISGGGNVEGTGIETIIAPAGATYLIVSGLLNTIDSFQVNEGDKLETWEAYGYKVRDEFLSSNILRENEIILNLPAKIPAVVGQELNIYFANITNADLDNYNIDVTCTIGKQFKNKYTVTPTAPGTYPITISVYNKNGMLICDITSNIFVVAANVGADVIRKVLVIGDSTVDLGGGTQRLLDKFSTDPMNITLLGGSGAAPNLHEGHSGWKASNFRGPESPFYDETTQDFDMNTYMTAKGYTDVDYVLIQLGINDVFNYYSDNDLNNAITSVLADYDTIINSIRAYNSNIKIGLNITIPPNSSQDVFGSVYGCGQTQWRYKRNNVLWVKKLIENYEGRDEENIYLIPIHVAIDTANNIDDAVHPLKAGFNQIGDIVYYWLKSFES